jgi:hypothetical protein
MLTVATMLHIDAVYLEVRLTLGDLIGNLVLPIGTEHG